MFSRLLLWLFFSWNCNENKAFVLRSPFHMQFFFFFYSVSSCALFPHHFIHSIFILTNIFAPMNSKCNLTLTNFNSVLKIWIFLPSLITSFGICIWQIGITYLPDEPLWELVALFIGWSLFNVIQSLLTFSCWCLFPVGTFKLFKTPRQ